MKHLIVLIGYVLIGLLATVFLMGADKVVPCGPDGVSQDLDEAVNTDDPTIGTRFQLVGGCTYTVDTVLALKNGDEIVGPQATFIERPPAFDPEPTVTIVASPGLSNVIRAEGRSEEHTSELQSRQYLVCRLLLEKKKKNNNLNTHKIKKKKCTIQK